MVVALRNQLQSFYLIEWMYTKKQMIAAVEDSELAVSARRKKKSWM